jgi:hypothetical protein
MTRLILWLLAWSTTAHADPSKLCSSIPNDDERAHEIVCVAIVQASISPCRYIDAQKYPVGRVYCEVAAREVRAGDVSACDRLESLGASRARTLGIAPEVVNGRLSPLRLSCRAQASRDVRGCGRVSDRVSRVACQDTVEALLAYDAEHTEVMELDAGGVNTAGQTDNCYFCTVAALSGKTTFELVDDLEEMQQSGGARTLAYIGQLFREAEVGDGTWSTHDALADVSRAVRASASTDFGLAYRRADGSGHVVVVRQQGARITLLDYQSGVNHGSLSNMEPAVSYYLFPAYPKEDREVAELTVLFKKMSL